MDASYAHAALAEQSVATRHVAARLLPAYRVDGGTVYLAGCRVEDRWFLRAETYQSGRQRTWLVDSSGQPVGSEAAAELGLWQTAPLSRPPRRMDSRLQQQLDRVAAAAYRWAGRPSDAMAVSLTVIWCKWVEGKLRFTVGEGAADLPFRGWARTLRAPPFPCPITGAKTYHLTGTREGRIVAAGGASLPAESDAPGDQGELVTCAVTGLQVLPERIRRCPVSGETVIREELVTCRSCHQEVSPRVVRHHRCQACRQLHPASSTDPRLARLFDAHPHLDRFGHWRITEAGEVYVLSCRRWLRRLVLVVDKQSLAVRRLAVGSLGASRFRRVEPGQYDRVVLGRSE
ncbi:MAG: hypothetical protein ACOC46_04570 [Pirellulales bacterium]